MSSELVLGIGIAPLDAFYKGLTAQVGLRLSLQRLVRLAGGTRAPLPTTSRPASVISWRRRFGVSPTAFPQLNWIVGSDVMWTPIYGKISWLNKSVGHFEVWPLGGSVVNERIARRRGQRHRSDGVPAGDSRRAGSARLHQQVGFLPARFQQRLRHLQGAGVEHHPRPALAGPELRRN